MADALSDKDWLSFVEYADPLRNLRTRVSDRIIYLGRGIEQPESVTIGGIEVKLNPEYNVNTYMGGTAFLSTYNQDSVLNGINKVDADQLPKFGADNWIITFRDLDWDHSYTYLRCNIFTRYSRTLIHAH